MKIVAIDDEVLLLNALVRSILVAEPTAQVEKFVSGMQALAFLETVHFQVDVVFLDIEMPGMNGVVLADKIKSKNPKINLIFVTGYTDYGMEALKMHASGYILKQVTAEKIRKELDNLRHPVVSANVPLVTIQCFGNFEVFFKEKPLKFRYSKSKELLAYLVDRNGALCTGKEAIAVLWEDNASEMKIPYYRRIRADLIGVFQQIDQEQVLCQQHGKLGINPNFVRCDYLDWLRGKSEDFQSYRGEYCTQYSWAEITTAKLQGV